MYNNQTTKTNNHKILQCIHKYNYNRLNDSKKVNYFKWLNYLFVHVTHKNQLSTDIIEIAS